MKVTIKQRLTLGLIMFLLPVWAYAQMVNIKGTVKDNKGETLMGVSILEVGSTSNGTITDLDGKFSITIPKTASLLFSYIGYEKQT
ncbi:MAG: carboxypeptidase-like regulatory domain-containing protein, partial [Paludibacter sp.]